MNFKIPCNTGYIRKGTKNSFKGRNGTHRQRVGALLQRIAKIFCLLLGAP